MYSLFCKNLVIFSDFVKFCLEQAQIACFSPKISRNFAGIAGFIQKQSTFLEILQIPGLLKVQRAGRQQNENDPLPPQTQRDLYNYLCSSYSSYSSSERHSLHCALHPRPARNQVLLHRQAGEALVFVWEVVLGYLG